MSGWILGAWWALWITLGAAIAVLGWQRPLRRRWHAWQARRATARANRRALRAERRRWATQLLSGLPSGSLERLIYPPGTSREGADPEAAERLWQEFDKPRPPYPDWYRPEDDRAAPLGDVRHGAGGQVYFARHMHDHRRGRAGCPACQDQAGRNG